MYVTHTQLLCYCYYIFTFILFYFISVFIMCFVHERLARILRATSIPRYDFNELIE